MRTTLFKNYLSTLSRYDNSVWKPIKSSRKPILAFPPLRLETPIQERRANSDKEKAAEFAKHLADIFQPHDQEPDEEITEFLELSAQPVEPIKRITPKEINDELGLFNKKKAPGMDLITPRMLHEMPRKGMVLLAYLFSAILRHHTN